LQPGGDLDLAPEALGADLRRQLLMEHFDGDVASMLEIFGEKNGGHAAATKLAFHGVRAGERVPQCVQQIRQENPRERP
jgi:hypothetical protein